MLAALNVFSGMSVSDMAKAKEFYVDKLGLKIKDDTMGLRLELPGGGELFLYEKPDHQPATFTVLNFVVEDIDAAVKHLTDNCGVSMERYLNTPGAQDDNGVMRSGGSNSGPDIAWFKDPSGNILSVIGS